MIDVKSLEFLATQAVNAKSPTSVNGADPRELTYLMPNGTPVGVLTKPKPRNHVVGSLDAIIALANRLKDSADPVLGSLSPVVWYSETKVVVVFDDAGHRLESAVFPLVFSDKFESVRGLKNASPRAHRDFIRFLRVSFADVIAAESLADKLESIRFKDEQVTTGKVLRTGESLGRSITSEANAEAPIPSQVAFEIPVYKVAGLRESSLFVNFVLDVNADEKTFRLVPFPDEIESAQQNIMDDIAFQLEEGLSDGIPCYYGQP